MYTQIEPFSRSWGLGPTSKLLGLGSQHLTSISGHYLDFGALGRLGVSSKPLGLGIGHSIGVIGHFSRRCLWP